MENHNKENKMKKLATRIPVPEAPLPPLPKHLLAPRQALGDRRPLRTLLQSNSRPTSSGAEKKEPLCIDTRYVTIRPRHENLDSDYKVFKDCSSFTRVITDDSDNENEVKFIDNNNDRNRFEDKLTSTPEKSLLEPKGVRNIKRSLKRPHSRELQGLSPPDRRVKLDERAKRRLVFNEKLEDRLSAPDFWISSYMACLTRDYTSDIFTHLQTVEQKAMNAPKTPSGTRSCIINWLIKVNGPDGNPATVQLACWYLDSILGTIYVELHELQLVAAACYWIAQKINGPVESAKKLIKCSDKAFSAGQLKKAERTILNALEFPVRPVVPQEFITYLSWWCDNSRFGEIEVVATFLCLSGLMVDKALCKEFPSVIAAASVRNALLLLDKRNLIMQLELCPIYEKAHKKTANMSGICSILRRSVRTISAVFYEYKAPLEYYNVPPYYIAQRIINAANELSVIDTRHTSRKQNY